MLQYAQHICCFALIRATLVRSLFVGHQFHRLYLDIFISSSGLSLRACPPKSRLQPLLTCVAKNDCQGVTRYARMRIPSSAAGGKRGMRPQAVRQAGAG